MFKNLPQIVIPKCSSGPIECSCDNQQPRWYFFAKTPSISAQNLKMFGKNICERKKISKNFSSVHLVCGFDTPD